jgi:hypothetical protein
LSSSQIPFAYEFEAPDVWAVMPPVWRESRGELNGELCKSDDKYFIKGNLWIPVIESEQEFNWTVWVEINQNDYERSIELWETAGRELEPPYPGKLANELPGYEHSKGLPLQVVTMGVGERPSFILDEGDHQLINDHRNGIYFDQVKGLSRLMAE